MRCSFYLLPNYRGIVYYVVISLYMVFIWDYDSMLLVLVPNYPVGGSCLVGLLGISIVVYIICYYYILA